MVFETASSTTRRTSAIASSGKPPARQKSLRPSARASSAIIRFGSRNSRVVRLPMSRKRELPRRPFAHLALDLRQVFVQLPDAVEDLLGREGLDDVEDLADLGLEVDEEGLAAALLHGLLRRQHDPDARAADVTDLLQVEND